MESLPAFHAVCSRKKTCFRLLPSQDPQFTRKFDRSSTPKANKPHNEIDNILLITSKYQEKFHSENSWDGTAWPNRLPVLISSICKRPGTAQVLLPMVYNMGGEPYNS